MCYFYNLGDMKINFTHAASFALLSTIALFTCCKGGSTAEKTDSVTKTESSVTQTVAKQNITEDSIVLVDIVKRLYKWHVTQRLTFEGFKPVKLNSTDSLYKGIDLRENQKSVDELKGTGLFTEDFLKGYRNIALRMDKELRDGSSLWPEGDLPSFNDDVDEWCDCQDSPVDDYWTIIKLTNIQINNNEAHFSWIWQGDSTRQPYRMALVKENDMWKINYMQGFDMKYYNWGAGKTKVPGVKGK